MQLLIIFRPNILLGYCLTQIGFILGKPRPIGRVALWLSQWGDSSGLKTLRTQEKTIAAGIALILTILEAPASLVETLNQLNGRKWVSPSLTEPQWLGCRRGPGAINTRSPLEAVYCASRTQPINGGFYGLLQ